MEGPYDSGTLHSIQDWYIKYQLNSVPGVAEVGSVGGFVREYQIDLDPLKLRAYNIPLRDVVGAFRHALIEEIILVSLAHVIFLWHFHSVLIGTIPLLDEELRIP